MAVHDPDESMCMPIHLGITAGTGEVRNLWAQQRGAHPETAHCVLVAVTGYGQ
jgi:hypothetical protein